MMVDAASRGANAIIAFATDGIFATHRLSVEIAQDKRLGNGKLRSAATACSFSQGCTLSRTSTLMHCRPTRLQSVHRRRVASAQPDYLQVRPLRNIWSRWLPRLGAKADPPFHFEYRACKTIGAADASRASCTLVGHWIAGTYSFGTLDRHIFRGREMQRDAQHRTEPPGGSMCSTPTAEEFVASEQYWRDRSAPKTKIIASRNSASLRLQNGMLELTEPVPLHLAPDGSVAARARRKSRPSVGRLLARCSPG